MRVASTASWSTLSTSGLVNSCTSTGSRAVRSVPRMSGDAASAHRLIWVLRSSTVRPSLTPLPSSSES